MLRFDEKNVAVKALKVVLMSTTDLRAVKTFAGVFARFRIICCLHTTLVFEKELNGARRCLCKSLSTVHTYGRHGRAQGIVSPTIFVPSAILTVWLLAV